MVLGVLDANKEGNCSEIVALLVKDGGLTVVVTIARDAEMIKKRGTSKEKSSNCSAKSIETTLF